MNSEIRIPELFGRLKPYIQDFFSAAGGGAGPYAPSPHDLSGAHHTGEIGDSQATQFLKTDGTRSLLGNMAVADTITIDGVDISAFKTAYDSHNHDHGALTGLSDDDHGQYLNNTRHDTTDRHGSSVVDHGGIGGLSDDDHTQYLLASGARAVAGNLLPDATDARDLGSSSLLWRKGWLSELDTVIFAQQSITLLGGWLLISKDEGSLDADLSDSATTANFGKAMTPGDFVLFRATGKVEYMEVGSLVSGTTYNVTRNLDGSGANAWVAGAPFCVLGQSGNGRIELNAYDTPRISILRQGATYNATTEVLRLGDLNGSYGISSELYGTGIGDYAGGNYLKYDPTNGFTLRSGGGNVSIDGNGITLAGELSSYNEIRWVPSFGSSDEVLEIGAYKESETSNYFGRLLLTALGSEESAPVGTLKLTTVTGWSGEAQELKIYSDKGTYIQRLCHSGTEEGATDGWIYLPVTCTYASATTFTISGDFTSEFNTGTKLRLYNGSTKYFYVVSSSAGGGTTTVTVTGGSDYSLADAAISAVYFSRAVNPQGFPDWFAWTPTFGGFSSDPTVVAYFKIVGRMCLVTIRTTATGTSNATSFTLTLPATPLYAGNMILSYAYDNGAAKTGAARGAYTSSNTTLTLQSDMASGAWTNSGNKYADINMGWYPI